MGSRITSRVATLRGRASRAAERIGVAVLGPTCRLGCGEHVYSRDVAVHETREHADEAPLVAEQAAAPRPRGLVHGKLLDDTRMCDDAGDEFASVFWGLVTCPDCVAAGRARGIDVRRCRGCGCTEDRACNPPCSWAGPDLCTTCATTGRVR